MQKLIPFFVLYKFKKNVMTLNSKEFQDMLKDFENNVSKIVYCTADFTKEPKEQQKKGHIYCNGEVNKLFKLYQFGYASGRCNYLN